MAPCRVEEGATSGFGETNAQRHDFRRLGSTYVPGDIVGIAFSMLCRLESTFRLD